MSIVKEEHKATLRKWHEELQEKRGERASLRRSTTVNDVCLTDGFRLFLKNRQSWFPSIVRRKKRMELSFS